VTVSDHPDRTSDEPTSRGSRSPDADDPASETPPTDAPATDTPSTDRSEQPPGDDDAARRGDARSDAPDDDASEDDPDDTQAGPVGQVAGGPGALLPRGGIPGIPAPPRRTGVFLDADDLRDHVGHLLRVMLGGYEVDAFGNFSFVHESARVFVTVGGSPIGPQVGVFSVTNLDIALTPQLAAFIATTNHRLGFGALSYDTDNHAVWLRHTLLGTALDAPELQAAVAAVASTAAHLDDQIAEQFGGRTFNDAPADMQASTRPPDTMQESFREGGATGYL
jgi:hypothetical protein